MSKAKELKAILSEGGLNPLTRARLKDSKIAETDVGLIQHELQGIVTELRREDDRIKVDAAKLIEKAIKILDKVKP